MSESAPIKQEIILDDKVTPALDAMIKAITGASTAMDSLIKSVSSFQSSITGESINPALSNMVEQAQSVANAFKAASGDASAIADASKNIKPIEIQGSNMPGAESKAKPNAETKKSVESGMGKMISSVKGGVAKAMNVFGAFGLAVDGFNKAIAMFSKIAELSDARSNSIAQLNMLDDAQRNGLDAGAIRDYGVKYANRIGMSSDEFMNQSMQLLNSTGGAFGSIGEAMNYNELMQKQMKMAGVSSQAADSVSLQWRQGLTKGFAAEEMNSVLENAPVLAQRLADTMGIEMGQLKDAASEGKITAEIAKKALFDNADDINSKFESMPKTWEQIGASIKNNAMQALDPVLQKISDLAQNPALEMITDKLTDGFAWFADVAGGAIDFVLNAISAIAPFVKDVFIPIKDILFSVWEIIKGQIDDFQRLFAENESFTNVAKEGWGGFKILLEHIKPIIEGFVEAVAGAVKVLSEIIGNVLVTIKNAQTMVHNLVSDDKKDYEAYSFKAQGEGLKQIYDGASKFYGNAIGTALDLATGNLKSMTDGAVSEIEKKNEGPDRIQADITYGATPTKPMHVKQVGKTKIDKESLQLLKDLAQAEIINRVNNIQPTISASFGDVHETADVDAMLERLEKDVVSARGQNLMLQTGLQYAI